MAEVRAALAQHVEVTSEAVVVDLADGRSVTAPLAWYARLAHGTPAERSRWRLIGRGEGVHWPDLDEDISVEGMLAGRPSNESQLSLQKWIKRKESLVNEVQRTRSSTARRRGPRR